MVYEVLKTNNLNYSFLNKLGLEYTVEFRSLGGGKYERKFYLTSEYNKITMYDKTNQNDAFSIFDTVSYITGLFIKEVEPEYIVIYHLPTIEEEDYMDEDPKYFEKNSNKRSRVSSRFLLNYMPENYKVNSSFCETVITRVRIGR